MEALKAIHARLGFPGIEATLVAARREAQREGRAAPTRQEVAAVVRGSDTNQQFARVKSDGKTVSLRPATNFMADLIYMFRGFKADKNKGAKYILLVVDAHSRKVSVKALEDKEPGTVAAATKDLLPASAKTLATDQGLEFWDPSFAAAIAPISLLLKETASVNALGLLDRAVGTYKSVLYKMLGNSTSIWIDKVDDAARAYNERYHSSLGVAPDDVEHGDEYLKLQMLRKATRALEHNQRRSELQRRSIEVGDKFRIPVAKIAMRIRIFFICLRYRRRDTHARRPGDTETQRLSLIHI